MTTLDVAQLRARYHNVDPVRLPVLDDALRELADHGLDDELASRGLGGMLTSAWAVCIDELVVDVDLDRISATRPVAASWAHAILDALTDAGVGTGVAAGLVVYRREADALMDVVTAVARGDLSRLWAWKQLRLVDRRVQRPTSVDVAAAVLARPPLIPAVLATVGPACRAIFGVDDWIRLAHAVAEYVGAPPWSPDQAALTTSGDGVSAPIPPESRGAVGRLLRLRPTADVSEPVPDHVWAAVADSRERWSLAVLCQAVVGPHLARNGSVISAIFDGVPSPNRASGHRQPPATSTSDTREPVVIPGELDGPARLDADAAITSAWGGVWFLARPLLELGVVDDLSKGSADVSHALDALAAIVVAVSGAPPDDPSVAGVCGRFGDVETGVWTPTPARRREVERRAAAITAWLEARAGGRIARLVEPSNSHSLWRRAVTIVASPGRIEVTSSLADVDIDVRAAGLDIDPGFVWWLGAVVGFRYV